jgi:uncharacterized protein (DUF1778 family)
MPKTQKQQEAANRYLQEKVDVISLRVKKGQKSEIQAHAQRRNESLNGFVTRAIAETLKRDTDDGDRSNPG